MSEDPSIAVRTEQAWKHYERVAKRAEASRESLRQVLLGGAVPTIDFEDLDREVRAIALAQGRYVVMGEVAQAVEFGATKQQVLALLVSIATRRVEDTWSGRGNDARRAHHEGKQDMVREIHDRLLDVWFA